MITAIIVIKERKYIKLSFYLILNDRFENKSYKIHPNIAYWLVCSKKIEKYFTSFDYLA